MKIIRFVVLASCFFATHAVAVGGIRPSFSPQESAWRATDIVVVTEGNQIDGVVQVLETLKGDLRAGATLTLPDLAEFKAKEARLIHDFLSSRSGPEQFVTGSRMILFLRDHTKIPVEDEEQNDFVQPQRTPARWSGANLMAPEVRYSTVWIEGEKTYAFYQLMNPGPSLLTRTLTDVPLRGLIADVTSEQSALNAAAAIVDLSDRAEVLRPFIYSSTYIARETAFVKLTECGRAALPVLSAELEQGLDHNLLADVVKALAKAAGRDAGPSLTKFLAGELEFWKQTAPTLKRGWWNGAGFNLPQMDAIKAGEPFRNRWMALLQTLYALREIRYTESANLVAELTELWRSLPQMSGDQVAEACEAEGPCDDQASPTR